MNTNTQVDTWLDNDPLVLTNRRLRPDVRLGSLSRFKDSTWDLSPGIFEDHSTKISLNFDCFPDYWRRDIKSYFWHLINDEKLRPMAAGPAESRPSLRTVSFVRPHLLRLVTWFESQGISSLGQATPTILDAMLGDLNETDLTYTQKRNILLETRRLWIYRDAVPASLRLPAAAPWHDERAYDLLGRPSQKSENLTPRIGDETLSPLLGWAMRFVENFADDIINGYNEYLDLIKHEYRHRPQGHENLQASQRKQRLQETLRTLKAAGVGLPGRLTTDGTREIRWQHLGRLASVPGHSIPRYDSEIITSFGLPIEDDAYLTTHCTGTLDGLRWKGRLAWDEIIPLATHLQTACFILLAYLSGMRPGEALTLERDCLSYDSSTGLWIVAGKSWKGAKESDGQKAAEGRQSSASWVVHPLAAEAIKVLTKLTPGILLFPVSIRPKPLRGLRTPENLRSGSARTSSQIGVDLVRFIDWVNKYCESAHRADVIPAEPKGRVSPSRFRRTLAWHIVRRPRGLVAAAIQYGHVDTYITQGYAGNYASGFPDELALERWLERIDNVQDVEDYLNEGGHVSGPAATDLKYRTRLASAKFLGRTIPTRRQATVLLADPSLQVFKGAGMHCVYDQTTALCSQDTQEPMLGQCQSTCSNIARTDADIIELRAMVADLKDDPLAPPIRYQRTQIVTKMLTKAILEHEGDLKNE